MKHTLHVTLLISMLISTCNVHAGGIKTNNNINLQYSVTQQTALYTSGLSFVMAGLGVLLLAVRSAMNNNNGQQNSSQIVVNAVASTAGVLISASGLGLIIAVPKIAVSLPDVKKE